MSSIFIVCAMLFMHILDDYVLQAPCLCNLKQKSFWEKNAPDEQYKKDYIVALIMHALSWSFMIMLPCAFALDFNVGAGFVFYFVFNTIFHAVIDHLKANVKVINLWIDQSCHMVQIAGTFIAFLFGGMVC
jgi:H+/Cl- antiporter ClcA